MSDGAPILRLTDITKNFGGLKVIDKVSFDVTAGSRTALIGPNGAGKTTIFNLISGIYPVDLGTVVLDGVDITRAPTRERVGHGLSRSFQNIRLMPHLSAIENIMLGQHVRASSVLEQLKPLGWGPGRRWARQAEEALEGAGLETFRGQVVANLPYGVQKRIEVLRALMAEPKLLLLDEPAAGLNPQEADELQVLLKGVAAGGVTLLVVEHDMHFVRLLCEHVIVLNFGRKIFAGTPEAVHKDEGVLEAYLGTQEDG
jgi:branched-chain amino acid transport system ATP-binding protein